MTTEVGLDLAAFDAAPFDGHLARAREAGVKFSSYVHLGGGPGLHDPALARRLHELDRTCTGTTATFEEYVEQRLSGPTFDPRGVVVAHVGEEWIGLSAVSVHDGWAAAETVGLLPARRGQGLAVALVVPAIRFTQRRAMTVLRATHRADDVAAAALHRRLGFTARG